MSRIPGSKSIFFLLIIALMMFVSCGTGQISTNKGERQRDKARSLRKGCCFTAETMVKMANGTEKRIDDLRVGDEVLSYNLVAGITESTRVMGLVSVEHNNLVEYIFRDSKVRATQDHPFYLKGKGWASSDPLATTQYFNFRDNHLAQIEPGDVFYYQGEDGKMKESTLLSIRSLNGNYQTFSIVHLEKNECYFANGRLTGVEEIVTPVVTIP